MQGSRKVSYCDASWKKLNRSIYWDNQGLMTLNSKQAKIYREIWASPYSKKLKFSDVSKLLVALGYQQKRAGGANVVFLLDGKAWGMHPPHPSPYLKRPYIKQLRDFLIATKNDNLLEE